MFKIVDEEKFYDIICTVLLKTIVWEIYYYVC